MRLIMKYNGTNLIDFNDFFLSEPINQMKIDTPILDLAC